MLLIGSAPSFSLELVLTVSVAEMGNPRRILGLNCISHFGAVLQGKRNHAQLCYRTSPSTVRGLDCSESAEARRHFILGRPRDFFSRFSGECKARVTCNICSGLASGPQEPQICECPHLRIKLQHVCLEPARIPPPSLHHPWIARDKQCRVNAVQ